MASKKELEIAFDLACEVFGQGHYCPSRELSDWECPICNKLAHPDDNFDNGKCWREYFLEKAKEQAE